MRLLSRYLLGHWLRVFLLTAIGLPFVSVLTQLTDNLRRLLDRDLPAGTIALSYLYALPQNIATMMPAAALFATVFTVGPLARNSERNKSPTLARTAPPSTSSRPRDG